LSSANFFVVLLVEQKWTLTTRTVTGDLTNFGKVVQSVESTSTKKTTIASPAVASPNTTGLKLAKTYKYTMDTGEFLLTVTPHYQGFNKSTHALVNFPTYYDSQLGDGLRCDYVDSEGAAETLYCALKWDWALEVWGPRVGASAAKAEFKLRVSGVTMNNPATARNL
jgi:hypothetical protein